MSSRPCAGIQFFALKMQKSFFVYILASGRNGTLYIGVTNDLLRRVSEHKAGQADGFTKKYKVNQLVWSGRRQISVLHFSARRP